MVQLGIKERIASEILLYRENNARLKVELSTLEKKVDRKKQEFLDIESDMEESDSIFEIVAELQRRMGIEPPERD
ncbi:MAG: hypothetical protein ACYCT2_01575 [Thermoplasmataceae archaeon]